MNQSMHMAKNYNLTSVGDTIKKIFSEENLDEKYAIYSIRKSWETIVGSIIAKHTTHINYFKGNLQVTLDSAVMRNECYYAKDTIIEKVNTFCGKQLIRELTLKT